MNINYKQSQFELFPGTVGGTNEVGRPRYMFANLNLSLENMVVVGIVVLMFLVFSFALGVERGKRIISGYSSSQMTVRKDKKESVVNPAAATIPLRATPTATTMPSGAGKPASGQPSRMSIAPSVDTAQNSPKALQPLTGKPFTIQVASFKSQQYAQKEAFDLKQKGYDILIVPKGQHFIVCVGQFGNEREAQGSLFKLKKQYRDSMVRRL